MRSLLPFVVCLAIPLTVHATIFVIAPDGSGDLPTIQAALDVAQDGDAIELTNGVFAGDGNRDLDFQDKQVVLRSQSGSPADCLIDCDGSEAEPHRLTSFGGNQGPETTLRGITVMHGYGTWGGAVRAAFMATPTLDSCVFVENRAEFAGGALGGDGHFTVLNCTFYANSAPSGGVISLEDWGGIHLENTILAGSLQGEAIHFSATGELSLSCCDLFGNAGGDWVGAVASQAGIAGNISEDPLFCDPGAPDFQLHDDSPCAAENNPACGQIGALGVGCGSSAPTARTWGGIKAGYRD